MIASFFRKLFFGKRIELDNRVVYLSRELDAEKRTNLDIQKELYDEVASLRREVSSLKSENLAHSLTSERYKSMYYKSVENHEEIVKVKNQKIQKLIVEVELIKSVKSIRPNF